jgi:hypothetical protein
VAPIKPKKITEEQPGQTKEQFIMRPQKERGEAREAERDKKGESSTDRGGRRMQLQRPRIQDHPKENTLAQ